MPSILKSLSIAPLTTPMEIGTSSRLCSRFCAVTMTSSSTVSSDPDSVVCPKAGDTKNSRANEIELEMEDIQPEFALLITGVLLNPKRPKTASEEADPTRTFIRLHNIYVKYFYYISNSDDIKTILLKLGMIG